MFRRTLASAALAALLALPGPAAAWQALMEPADLAAVLETGEPVLLDIRSPAAYAQGHLPMAVNAPYAAFRGPEENPGALVADAKLTAVLSEAGVSPDRGVVVTHAGKGPLDFGAAARVYWTLRSAGVARVAILNGGVAGWAAAGETLETAEWADFPSDAAFSVGEDWRIGREGIAAVLEGRRDALLLDARIPDYFDGRKRHAEAAAAGTLAGAVNLPSTSWFEDGRLVATPETARDALAALGWTPGRAVVSFCDTGHWAATNWFVLTEIAGIADVRLYPESLVGWGRDGRIAARD